MPPDELTPGTATRESQRASPPTWQACFQLQGRGRTVASTAGKEPGSDRSAGAQGIQVDGILEKARSQREVRLAALRRTQRDGRALYADENGKPRLLPSFVVYLDELGTSQRIAAMNDEDLERDIQDYDDLRWFLHDQKTGWADEFQRTLYFSDNVVVAA